MKKIIITFKDRTILSFTFEHEFDLHNISNKAPLCFNNMWINMDEVRFIEVKEYEQ